MPVTLFVIGSYCEHALKACKYISFVNFICRKCLTARRLVRHDLLPTFVP
nr:MAG TPA: hypothetical protein [Caudoviricetes sp.]